jgi:hypothetical protein
LTKSKSGNHEYKIEIQNNEEKDYEKTKWESSDLNKQTKILYQKYCSGTETSFV